MQLCVVCSSHFAYRNHLHNRPLQHTFHTVDINSGHQTGTLRPYKLTYLNIAHTHTHSARRIESFAPALRTVWVVKLDLSSAMSPVFMIVNKAASWNVSPSRLKSALGQSKDVCKGCALGECLSRLNYHWFGALSGWMVVRLNKEKICLGEQSLLLQSFAPRMGSRSNHSRWVIRLSFKKSFTETCKTFRVHLSFKCSHRKAITRTSIRRCRTSLHTHKNMNW